MNLKSILTTLALTSALTVTAQPSDWNVQYIKQKDYGSPRANNPRKIDLPDLDGYKAIKVDLHLHTVNSDGDVSPRMRVMEAWREGLDAIAITDHQPCFGAKEGHDYDLSFKQASAEAAKRGITLIHGLEISHNQNEIGHINLLFVKECNAYRIPQNFGEKETHEALVQAAEEGAFVTGNHPGWPDQNSELSKFWIDEIEAGRIQGMEIFNAYEFYPLAIDHVKKYNLTAIGASDQHRPMDYDYDLTRTMRPMTIVYAKSKSLDDIHEALRARRTLAMANGLLAGDRNLLLKFLRASLKLELAEPRGNCLHVRIYNASDVDFTLDCGLPSKMISIPAHRIFDTDIPNTDLPFHYRVTNMFVSSTECLDIPLSLLTTPQGDIDRPVIDEAGIVCGPDGKIRIPLINEPGQTYYTLDGSVPSPTNGLPYTEPVTIKSSCTLKAKTFDSGKESFVLEYPLEFLKASEVKAKKKGLDYKYYADPAIRSITSVKHLTEARCKYSGVAAIPSLQPREEEDWFGYVFEGYIKAPVSGIYTFKLDTDDGSQLYIDGSLVIDSDFNAGNSVTTGYAYLEAGMHELKLPYFEGHYAEKLELYWHKPGATAFEPVPADAFFRK